MINVDGLESLKMNGQQYKVDHSLREIKVNNPSPGKEKLIQLIAKTVVELGNDVGFKLILKAARMVGWKESGESVSDYINNYPKKIPTFYSKIVDLTKTINEIKINKPLSLTEFPIKINSMEEWKKVKPLLSKKGYEFFGGDKYLFHSGFPSYIFQKNPYQLNFPGFFSFTEFINLKPVNPNVVLLSNGSNLRCLQGLTCVGFK